jgi:hypothetical protein
MLYVIVATHILLLIAMVVWPTASLFFDAAAAS